MVKAAKQHDIIRLCHVNPAQFKEVTGSEAAQLCAYNTNQCQQNTNFRSYLLDGLPPLNYTLLVYLSAARL